MGANLHYVLTPASVTSMSAVTRDDIVALLFMGVYEQGASVKRGSLCSECNWRWTVWFVVHCCYIMKNGQSHVLSIHECIRYIYQYRLNWSMLKGHHS